MEPLKQAAEHLNLSYLKFDSVHMIDGEWYKFYDKVYPLDNAFFSPFFTLLY